MIFWEGYGNGQGYFSKAFMADAVFFGKDSYQAFFNVLEDEKVRYHDQQPQFTYGSDIHFFGY